MTRLWHRAAIRSAVSLLLLFCGARAHAQVADDALLRVWLDTTFYTGSPGPLFGGIGTSNAKVTVLAPVLQADIRVLDLVRVGLDLPFAAGFVSRLERGLPPTTVSGSQLILANPTLHAVVEIQSGPLLARAGLGAVVEHGVEVESIDDFAGRTAMLFGAVTRGMWNAFWYLERPTIYAPGEVTYRGNHYAFGIEGAPMLLIPHAGALQIGPYLAAVSGKTNAIGIRWRNFIGFGQVKRDTQSSLEVYAESRVMKLLLLGGGVLVNLDEPFGVFGAGLGVWSVRLQAGLLL